MTTAAATRPTLPDTAVSPGGGHPRAASIQPSFTASTASSARETTPYRSNSRRTWLSTVRAEMPSRAPISSLVAPRWIAAMTSISRADGGRGAYRAASQRGRRERRPAVGNRPNRRQDLRDLGGLVKEPGRAALERLAHERRPIERGQDDGPNAGLVRRGDDLEPVHPGLELDVAQHDIRSRMFLADQAQRVGDPPRRADDPDRSTPRLGRLRRGRRLDGQGDRRVVVDDGQGDLGRAWIEGVVHRTIMAGA